MPRRKTKGQIKKAEEIPEGLESLTYELTHEEAVARMNYLEKEEERYKHTLNDRILDFLMRQSELKTCCKCEFCLEFEKLEEEKKKKKEENGKQEAVEEEKKEKGKKIFYLRKVDYMKNL